MVDLIDKMQRMQQTHWNLIMALIYQKVSYPNYFEKIVEKY